MEKPKNILFVFTDQQRADTIGFKVGDNEVTPNLSRIAEDGTLFENAFTCQPVCGPARACIQTGTYATENGIYRNGLGLDMQPQNQGRTLATWLSKAGYEVGYIGKWHLGSNSGRADFDIGEQVTFHRSAVKKGHRGGYNDFWLAADGLEHTSHGYNGMVDQSWGDGPHPKGFMFDTENNKVEFEGYRVDAQTDFVLDYIKNRSGDRPWFLFTSYLDPHHQNDHQRYEGPKGSKEMFKIPKDQVPKDLWGAEWLNEGDWEKNYPDYLGACWSLDKNFNRIIELLKEKDMLEDTLVIYTSDHGSHFHTREGEYKRNSCDGCLNVPMIIRGPGFNNGVRVKSLVSILDLVPTILQAAGVPIPDHIRGKPLQLLSEGNIPDEWPDAIFAEISESQVGRAIRTHKWKYSMKAPGLTSRAFSKSPIYMEEFLFDLENDPSELINLVDDPKYSDVRKELGEKLKDNMVEIGEKRPIIIESMEIPKPPLLMESGLINIDEAGLVSVNINTYDTSVLGNINVPIGELIEDILGIPIILDINGTKRIGTLSIEEGSKLEEGPLELISSDGEIFKIKDIISEIIGKVCMLSAMIPSDSMKSKNKEIMPKYYIFIFPQ
jgi:arylsulfatase A-like enzyme